MKNALVIITLIASLPLFSQITNNKNTTSNTYSENLGIKIFQENDTTSKSNNSKSKSPAFFINGVFANETIFKQLNPLNIDSMYIENTGLEKEGRVYKSKLFVEMNSEYAPSYVTLKALVNKYLDLNTDPIIFQFDNKIIDVDFEKYLIDEKFIFKIIKSKIKTSNGIEINLVEIFPKT